jgi:hypothetical protein
MKGRASHRRAIEHLAACGDGCTEELMLAHGFSIPLMVELINGGLASASVERVIAGRQKIEVARVRITEAGRRMLAQAKRPR